MKKFLPGSEQSHSLWAVGNHSSKVMDVEFGIGFGLTPATDKVTLKLMVSRDLNHPHEKTQARNFK